MHKKDKNNDLRAQRRLDYIRSKEKNADSIIISSERSKNASALSIKLIAMKYDYF